MPAPAQALHTADPPPVHSQDQMLGGSFPQLNGVGPMPNAKARLQDEGAMATNFFIHTPICCPSRSELVSGRYFHNLKVDPAKPRKKGEIICMHVNESKVNGATFAKTLSENAGYKVGMFGKWVRYAELRVHMKCACTRRTREPWP